MTVGRLTDDWYFVCGIDVVAPRETGAIVAVGDSLTDANISTHDGHHSWPSQLARRAFDDATVLRIARAYERATEWHARRPDPRAWTPATSVSPARRDSATNSGGRSA
jgi:hypothetical protein